MSNAPELTSEVSISRAARFEKILRAEGYEPMMIPGMLGAAYMASLINLPADERERVLRAHLAVVEGMIADLLAAPQAP